MKSFKQIYQKLPEEFLENVSARYEPHELEKMLAGFMCERSVTLRVNRMKTDVRQVMEVFKQDNIKFDRVLWYEDGLIIRNKREKDLEKHVLYQEGHIYLQSLSSMIPPLVLKPEPGSKVLDLTAAPGGKSTQLAALMNNQGFLLANEINQIRAERLKFNVLRQGAEIIQVRVGDGKRLDDQWQEFFDYVLLDAPCSGVGLFLTSNPASYRGWTQKMVNQLAKEQKKLLESAFRALKPGGVLVYSTCTLTREENEDNIIWFLEKYGKEITLEKLNLPSIHVDTAYPHVKINNHKDCMMVILPSANFEGFFITRFRKNERIS